tara:strand:- start:441 stop:1349 length:909 start_codon:yes stop_codon:yes gene_type:complete
MAKTKFDNFLKKIKSKFHFDYNIKKLNWFNIGGEAKAFFKPDNLNELSLFLKEFGHEEKIFVLGAGSNILLNDSSFEGVVIKLGKNFSNISLLQNNIIIAGSATTDKKLSEFAMVNEIGGFEFLSCIPGTVGGGIKINSGCYGKEFKDILISIQVIDKRGQIKTIPKSDINFGYRESNLNMDYIFLSASFKGTPKKRDLIEKEIKFLKEKKEKTQPSKIKTGGSTFKNPKKQTSEKVWKLIERSVPKDINFGDAEISQKHSNFLINKGNASFEDMLKLINFIKKNVKSKTGIEIETEIEIIG